LKCKMCQNTFETRKSKPKVYCSKKCSNNDPTIKEKIVESQKKHIWRNIMGIRCKQTKQKIN
jgi:hypothetical protein